MKTKQLSQPALFNTDAYAIPQASFLETHPDSEDLHGDDTESCVPDGWEELRQSQQRCAQLRDRIQAIYADAQAEGFTRRLPVEYERAIRELNCEIIAELEASKEVRTARHNYRGWMGEISIAESVTRIKIVDSTGWLSYDDIIEGTSKAVAMLRMMQFIDAAIEKEERSPSPLPPVEVDSVSANDSVSLADSQNDSVSPPTPDCDSLLPANKIDTESTPVDTESSSGVKYVPKGTARTKSTYFRYSYRDGSKMKHVHIPGGNTSNPVARRNWQLVLASKSKGMTSAEIVEMIKTL